VSRTDPQEGPLFFTQGTAMVIWPYDGFEVAEAQRRSASLHMCGIRVSDVQGLVVYWPNGYPSQAYGKWRSISPNARPLRWEDLEVEQPIDEGYLTVCPPEACPPPGDMPPQ
jgi:hypothetical protein